MKAPAKATIIARGYEPHLLQRDPKEDNSVAPEIHRIA
jgi:hypothetical protein